MATYEEAEARAADDLDRVAMIVAEHESIEACVLYLSRQAADSHARYERERKQAAEYHNELCRRQRSFDADFDHIHEVVIPRERAFWQALAAIGWVGLVLVFIAGVPS